MSTQDNTSFASGEYTEDFAADVASDIGSELFSKNTSTELVEPPAETTAPAAEPRMVGAKTQPGTDNPAGLPGDNPAVSPAAPSGRALPKAWKKDMEAHWSKLPPEVHEYVYAREADVMRGLQQYQQGHNQWQELLRPYGDLFTQHRDVNPVSVMQGLMNTHLQLLNPSVGAQQKLSMLQDIARGYGLTLGQATDAANAPPEYSALLTRVEQAERAAREAAERLQSRERAEYDAGVRDWETKIEAFAADPANKHFQEVGQDMLRLIQTGAAQDLKSAYETACWTNPLIRAKMLAEQQATAAAETSTSQRQRQRDSATGRFVELNGEPPVKRQQRPGTIDNTIDALVAKHYNPANNL